MANAKSKRKRNRWLVGLGLFKLGKAALLAAVTAGVLSLLHKNVALHVSHWVDVLRLDPDNRYIAAGLDRLHLVHTRELKELSFLTSFYAALFLGEGIGLVNEKVWAEWLTIVATGLFIPAEIYELVKEPGAGKAVGLLINMIVVAFLSYLIANRESKA